MSSTFRTLGQSELLPRYIFAESLYARRRVLEIGAVASTLGQSARFLSTRGARIVVAADSDLSAVQDAQARLAGPNLRFRASVFDDLEAGSFDLVIVADLAGYVRAPELLKELVRLIAKNGYLMGGLRNPGGFSLANVMEAESVEVPPTYGLLLDALTPHFRSIEVATQSPVLGYQLAFEKGEGLQVDGSLAGTSEAAYYVVLAGHDPVRFFDPTWVQLPPEPLAFTGGKLEDASARARTWQERSDKLKVALGKSTEDVGRREVELHEVKQQLEAGREAVARLTAQLESATQRPQESRQADELTARVRRMEAELTVARERASDAEGRVTSMRAEVELHQREQKTATIETLAAQENVRLERTRREELVSQLEDARTRLTKAYEELRVVQDEAAANRVDIERAKLETSRIVETVAVKERELGHAREKELRLAQAQSDAQSAIEGLQRQLTDAQKKLEQTTEGLSQKDAERTAALRSLELESSRVRDAQTEVQNLGARLEEVSRELADEKESLTGAETELESVRAEKARLQRDIETLANSERTWREMAQQFEGRLNETLANVTALSEQVARLEGERDQEQARFRRLEGDLSTAVGAERSAREQAQALHADAQARVQELQDDNHQLVEQRDDLNASIADLTRARVQDGQKIDELSAKARELEDSLDVARAQHAELTEEAKRATESLQQSLSEKERAWDESRAALGKQLEQLKDTLREREHAWDDTRHNLGTQLESLSEAAASHQAKVTSLTEQLHDAVESADRARDEFDRQLLAASERDTQSSRELATLRAESARLGGQLEHGRERVAELALRASRLEIEGTSLKGRLAESESHAAERQARIAELTAALTAAEQAAQSTDAALRAELAALDERASSERETSARTIARLQEQLEVLELSGRQASNRAVERERELEQLRDSLAATEMARERLEELVHADRHENQGEVTAFEARLTAANDELKRRADNEARLAEQIAAATEELELTRERLIELREAHQAELLSAAGQLEAAREVAARELQEFREGAERELQASRGVADQRLSELEAEGEGRRVELVAKQAELEGRVTELTEQLQHVEAELAFGVEARAAEAELREKVEGERDRLRDEASQANQWVVGGKQENERLVGDLAEARADAERAQLELHTARQNFENSQRDLDGARTEIEIRRAAEEAKGNQIEALTGQLSAARAEVGLASQQLTSAQADAARAGAESVSLREELAALQARFDVQSRTVAAESEASRDAHQRELEALKAQVEAAHGEQHVMKGLMERAQSEARGHQSTKLSLQSEHDKLRTELTQLQASLAMVGGEAKAVAEARERAEAELQRFQQRAEAAEQQQAETQARIAELEASVAQAAEREKGVLAQLDEVKGSAQGSAGELEAAVGARRLAEDLLLKLRTRYGELEAQLANELPPLREQLGEARSENQLLDTERDRLALHIERLEAARAELESRLQAVQLQLEREKTGQVETLYQAERERAALEAQLKLIRAGGVEREQRLELLERRLKAQEAELAALRRRPNVPSQPGAKPAPPMLRPVAPPIAPVAPVDVELEVFELDIDENGDDEELLLLEDEASDPGSRDPRKP